MKKLSKLVSLMLSVVLCIGMAAPAFAIEYQVDVGRVYIENDESGKAVSWQENHATHNSKETASDDKEIVITGTYTEEDKMATGNRVTVGENVTDTTITLRDVNIDVSETGGYISYKSKRGEAALSIGKDSNVTIDLEGENTLKSGYMRTGLELNSGASVTIQSDSEQVGTLSATGGEYGAGIGGGDESTAGNITISGGNVTATGGKYGAGIGGGDESTAGNITISGGNVTATGGKFGAGIGGGDESTAGNITISGGDVTATGGEYGAGIGGGNKSKVGEITISNGTVTATGGHGAAGIGTGRGAERISSVTGDITISGGDVTTTGGKFGAGIGAGYIGKTGTIRISGGKVEATSNWCVGIGVGYGVIVNYRNVYNSTTGDIIISGGDVTATGTGYSPGIGCGDGVGKVGDITISDGAKLTSTGYFRSNGSVGNIEVRTFDEDGNLSYIHDPKVGNRVEYTITPPEGKEITVNDDLTVEIPAGSTATDRAGNKIPVIDGGSIDLSGTLVKETHDYQVTDSKEPTCEEDGYTTYTCSRCQDTYTETFDANGHGEGVWTVTTPAQPGVEGVESLICPNCEVVLGTRPIPTLPVPAIPDDGGADTVPATATIADQEVPLAGLMPLYMLLEELRQYEEIPEIELPEDFKWIDHAYAQAIYWGLQEELVVDTEEEPLDPDEALTVGPMREVLVNFVERYLGLDSFVVTLAGEDDELVMDLGERLTAFYTELETALAKQEKAA